MKCVKRVPAKDRSFAVSNREERGSFARFLRSARSARSAFIGLSCSIVAASRRAPLARPIAHNMTGARLARHPTHHQRSRRSQRLLPDSRQAQAQTRSPNSRDDGVGRSRTYGHRTAKAPACISEDSRVCRQAGKGHIACPMPVVRSPVARLLLREPTNSRRTARQVFTLTRTNRGPYHHPRSTEVCCEHR